MGQQTGPRNSPGAGPAKAVAGGGVEAVERTMDHRALVEHCRRWRRWQARLWPRGRLEGYRL